MYRRLFLQGLLYIQLFFVKTYSSPASSHMVHTSFPTRLTPLQKKGRFISGASRLFFFSEKMPAVLQIVGRADAGAAQLWELERPLQKRVGEDDVDHGRF